MLSSALLSIPGWLSITFAVLSAISFPISIYFWGPWATFCRGDPRYILRCAISGGVVFVFYSIVLFLVSSSHRGLQINYLLGQNFFAELLSTPLHGLWVDVSYALLGIGLTVSLYLGTIVDFGLSYLYRRNYYRKAMTPPVFLDKIPCVPDASTEQIIKYEVRDIVSKLFTPNTGTNIQTWFQKCQTDLLHGVGLLKASINTTPTTCPDARPFESSYYELLRNQIIAPFLEEGLYRTILFPLLLHCTESLSKTIIYAALLFASSHVHHGLRHYRETGSVKTALLRVGVQFTYCFLFSLFCGYIYALPYITTPSSVQTSLRPLFSFPAAVCCHMICNFFGLPSLESVSPPRGALAHLKTQILCTHIFGVALFISLLFWLPAN